MRRFLIIEDSPYTRQMLKEMIRQEFPDAEITLAASGSEGFFYAMDTQFDLILLDLELPQMDGFSILRMIMAKKPTPVIVVSKRMDHHSILKALELGALDFVVKPTQTVSTQIVEMSETLREKIRGFAQIRFPERPTFLSLESLKQKEGVGEPQKILPTVYNPPRKVIGIGASTGGPGTLLSLLKKIEIKPWVALILAQHLPEGFTEMFAHRLNQQLPYPVQEAHHFDRLEGGKLYVLVGGMNTTLIQRRDVQFVLEKPEGNQGYVPSVNRLFQALAEIYGKDAMGIVCTGMGDDGSHGAQLIQQKGGWIIAEDPRTAIIGSMPMATIARANPQYVVPLEEMAGVVNPWILGVLRRKGGEG